MPENLQCNNYITREFYTKTKNGFSALVRWMNEKVRIVLLTANTMFNSDTITGGGAAVENVECNEEEE